MPLSSPATGRAGGLLLVRADPHRVAAWVRRGVVAAHVTPLGEWTAVTPASGRAAPPYDDARTVLLARPLATALRPSIGFFVSRRRGVVVVQPPGWRALARWLVWSPDVGVVRSRRLASARPGDLASIAGVGAGGVPKLVTALRGVPSGPLAWLGGVHSALGLPGHDLLMQSDGPRGELVEPEPESVARFDAMTGEQAAHLAEVGSPDRSPGRAP